MGQDEIAYRDTYVPELILHLFSWIGQFKMKFYSFQMIIETSVSIFFFFFIICLQESKRFEGFIFSRSMVRKFGNISVLFLFSRLTGN